MKSKLGFLSILFLSVVAFSQETYSTWAHFKSITINTSANATGANLAGGVGKFPLLVRLTSANSDVFSQASANGADIRFTKVNGTTRLPHQRERFDSTNQVAEFWVLVDTLNAGDSTQSIRMYWGKTGAADSSNGPQVFSPGNGYLAVWHMNDTTDATGNNHTLSPAPTAPVAATVPLIGSAKSFTSGTTQAYVVNNATDLNLNTDNGPYTVTAWAATTLCSASTRYAIVSKYDNSNSATVAGRAWALQTSATAGNWRWSNDPLSFYAASATAGNWEYTNDATGCTVGTEAAPVWTYLAGRNFSTVAPDQTVPTGASRVTLWKDSTVSSATQALGSIAPQTIGTVSSVYIGRLNDGSRYLTGDIDEITISNVYRSADWLKLNNKTQKAGATVVTLGATQASASVPGAPTAVTDSAGNAQVIVSWTAPSSNGGSTITGYTVSSTPTSAGCTTTGSLACTVTGLTNGTSYTFTVTATNSVGTSAASAASPSVTPTAPPGVPNAPTNTTAIFGNGRATISWTASITNGSAVTGYIVTSNPDGKTCSTTGALSCVDSLLTNGTAYTFTVVATSSAGNSAASVATTPGDPVGVPGAPTIGAVTAGNAQVVVNWTAPASNGGSAITSYTATSVADTSKHCTATGAATLTCTVTGLTNGTAYTFTVKAANAIGSSIASAASSSATPITVPGAPAITSVVGASGQVTVTWTAPSSTGGSAITGYTATAVSDTSKHCSTTTALTCAVTGLTNTTAYTFTVIAINAAGKGAASPASASVTNIASFAGMGIHMTASSMTLHLPEFTGIAQVAVMDVWGRTLVNKTVTSGMHEVTLNKASNIVPGLYIVRLVIQDANHKSHLAAESKFMLTP